MKKGKEKGKESSSKNVPSCQSDEKIRRKNQDIGNIGEGDKRNKGKKMDKESLSQNASCSLGDVNNR